MISGYSKRFAASATGYAHKYRFDPFFRTEVNVIALQVAFALFFLGLVGITATRLYSDASSAVSQGISSALEPHSTPASIGNSVVAQLNYLRSQTVVLAMGAIVIVTVLFSYLVARMALSPVKHALESQKQFIGNVAHELRTPLSVIKTNTEVALMSAHVEEGLRTTLGSTVEELDRISEIINNLLSLSASIRPERLEFGDVDLGMVVQGVLQKLRGLTDPKHLEIEARISERKAAWGNTTALEQIVMNIIKNAVVYTRRGGRIIVTVEPVYPDFMELTVQDSGTGIARKDLFRIFEPYYRADPSRRREGSGSGLGLTIVSELVKLHNGKITVRSAQGRGTTVTVLLPAGRYGVGARDRTGPQHDNVSEVAVDFSHNGRRSA